MKSKILRIVLDVALSVVAFFVVMIILGWASYLLFGTTKGADGQDYTNVSTPALLGIAFVVTIAFGVWFYRFLTKRSVKAEE
jgi:UDP-N-acetylmuramyl pentapeptide phosphotransferase/UDP-N-acetylglucosamine-1-phosphate transferase